MTTSVIGLRHLVVRCFPRRSLAPSSLSRRVTTAMASGSPPVIVLSDSEDEGDEKRPAAAAKRARTGKSPVVAPAAPPPPAAARDAKDGKGETKASPPPTTPLPSSSSSSFDLCDPLHSCGFALTAAPRLALEPGFENCNASADRGARLSDLVTGSPRNALVSNFMIDPVWLFQTLPALRNVRGHLAIAMGDDRMVEATRQSLLVYAAKGCASATVTRPPTEAYGTHHSKFFLLEYGWGLCVVVVTGNFIPHEYDAKTQAVWFQKFPWKDAQSPRSSDFEERLFEYVERLKLPAAASKALLGAVKRCDFSSARADLVVSVPGNHRGRDYERLCSTGRLRSLLSKAKEFSDSLVGSSQLVAQCSSLGKLNENWIAAWTDAASGGVSRSGAPLGPPAEGRSSSLPLSIVWPTADEVQTSVEGWSGGGSIPGRRETLSLPSISSRLCRWASDGGRNGGGGGGGPGTTRPLRSRAVPHIKTFCRVCHRTGQLAWLLVGSPNLSVAAWGSATKARDSSYVRSWELSVLLTPEREAAYRRHRHRGFNGGGGGDGAAAAPAATAAAAASDAAPFPPGSLLLAAGRTAGGRAGPLLPADGANFVEFYAAGRAPGQTTANASEAGPSSSSSSAPAAAKKAKVEIVSLPIPYSLPPSRYRPGVDQPWVTDVAFPGPDSLGRYLSPN